VVIILIFAKAPTKN